MLVDVCLAGQKSSSAWGGVLGGPLGVRPATAGAATEEMSSLAQQMIQAVQALEGRLALGIAGRSVKCRLLINQTLPYMKRLCGGY